MNSSTTETNPFLQGLLNDGHWKQFLSSEFNKQYFTDLENKLAAEYNAGEVIFPPKELIFNALNLTPLDKVKVVIIGQDPYPGEGRAMGLAFSVPPGMKLPRSLQNIYKELVNDVGIKEFKKPDHGNLEAWAKQGVLLLNATLTMRKNQQNSHANYGWQTFTNRIIEVVSQQRDHVVFMLWGEFAQKKEQFIDRGKHPHTVIKTSHPSPLSANRTRTPFLGSCCFSECNSALKDPINWSL